MPVIRRRQPAAAANDALYNNHAANRDRIVPAVVPQDNNVEGGYIDNPLFIALIVGFLLAMHFYNYILTDKIIALVENAAK